MAWPPQVRTALAASAAAFSITVCCAAQARSSCSLLGSGRASVIAWNQSALVCSSMTRISATAICLVGYIRRFTGGRAGPFAAQVGHGEVVGRLGDAHVGRATGS